MITRAYVFLLLTALVWASNAVAGRLAVGHVSPFVLTTLRWAIAVVAVGLVGHRRLRHDWPVVRRHLPMLAAMGTVGFTLFNATFYTSARYTTALNMLIIQAGMPLVIFLANFVLFRTRVSAAQFAGFALTLAGVLTVAAQGSLGVLLNLHLNHGDALMLLATTFYGLYSVSLRWMPEIHLLSFMIVLSVAALITSLPFSGFEIATGAAHGPDTAGLAIALFTGIFPSLVAQMSFAAGNRLIGSNRAGLFMNFVPVFGAILSVLVLGERLKPYHAAALVLVVGGVALAQKTRRPA
ncbi:DMT family transporter [Acidimangrovimonas sediminis]|uniref:DMT family transporter n=1 Tax=Acidimangrovimonas sediminis TaxID=2056283 RepID=UPI000C7FADA8|nr:DMT family transporter [Acidimangrovimonas sediminis]